MRSLLDRSPAVVWTRSACLAWFLTAVTLPGCGGIELRPARPDARRDLAKVDPRTFLTGDSRLDPSLTVDLGPLLGSLRATLASQTDELAARWSAPPSSPAAAPSDPNDASAEMAWTEPRPGLRTRLALFPLAPVVRAHDGVMEVELRFAFSAATLFEQRRQPPKRSGCGCGGEPWCGGEPEPPRRAFARWSGHLALSDAWRLEGQPRFEVQVVDPCVLPTGAAPLDVGKQVTDAMTSAGEQAAATIARALSDFQGVEQSVKAFWSKLFEPSAADAEAGPWLFLRPRALGVSNWAIRSDVLWLQLVTLLNPVLLRDLPTSPQAAAWPAPAPSMARRADPERDGTPLDLDTPAAREPGFRLLGSLELKLEELAAGLAPKLLGRQISQKPSRSLKLSSIALLGLGGDRVALELGVQGAATGRVHVLARIRADADGAVVALEELALSPATRDALAALYDEIERADLTVERTHWVDEAALLADLAASASVPLTAPLRQLRRSIEDTVSRRAVGTDRRLWVAANEISFVDRAVTADTLSLLFLLRGRAVLDPLPPAPAARGERR